MRTKKKRQVIKRAAPKEQAVLAVKKKANEDLSHFTIKEAEPGKEEEATNETFNISPQDIESSRSSFFWNTRTGIVWAVSFVLLILVGLIGGFLIFQAGMAKNNNASVAPSSPSVTVSQVSPSPTISEIDYSSYEIRVLNGSGIAGEAARAQGLLQEEKFEVLSVDNADNPGYQNTTIQAKKTVSGQYLEKLKSFLEKSYVLDNTKELADSEESDVVIIIGSLKVE